MPWWLCGPPGKGSPRSGREKDESVRLIDGLEQVVCPGPRGKSPSILDPNGGTSEVSWQLSSTRTRTVWCLLDEAGTQLGTGRTKTSSLALCELATELGKDGGL